MRFCDPLKQEQNPLQKKITNKNSLLSVTKNEFKSKLLEICKHILTPISALYLTIVRFRHFLYDHKILTKKFAPLPVISIGNVMVGGVGKTQVALLLAELFSKEFRVAVLSRGYSSSAEHGKNPLVVNANNHVAKICGDEPLMLASRLSSTLIVVNKNRYKCALIAEKMGAQLLLLDDGMQHRKLYRDFEIVVIDGKKPFGNFLPKGRLREDLQRLKVSNLIFFVGVPDENMEKKVASLTTSPQVVAKIKPIGIFQMDGEPINHIEGKKVGVFCGIGNPNRFVKTVEELGVHVVATHFSSDHRILGEKDLRKFAIFSMDQGATLLLCSEKDKVKLYKNSSLPLPVGWVQVTLEIVKNQPVWLKAINEMKALALKQGRL